MKILIFNTFYHPKKVGGAEVSVQLLAEGLRAEGHRVYVVTFGASREIVLLNGVVVIRVRQRNVYSTWLEKERSGWRKAIWHLLDSCNVLYYFLIRNLIRRIDPAVVHTHNIQGFSPFLWKVVKKCKKPLVHTMRDYYLMCHQNTLYSRKGKCEGLCRACRLTHSVKKTFAGHPDVYVGISGFILKKHRDYLPLESKKTEVVYNAVAIPPAVGIAAEKDALSGPAAAGTGGEQIPAGVANMLVLGFMGRISPQKGAGYLAAELARVRKELRPFFRIVFAGKGEPEYIQRLRETLSGVAFDFPGTMSPEAFYRQVDLSITPSLWDEPFGRVVIESLSHAVPVVLAESGGLAELHRPDCTWSFAPRDGQLYPLIERILENPQELAAKKERCAIRARAFSQERTIRGYLDIYEELAAC